MTVPNLDRAVRERYAAASQEFEPGLCCPVDYDPQYLKVIPQDVLERDYGCGDPVSHVRSGERVLDLGSGAGKVCFIAAQIVGPKGSVIGVDVNDDMLALARSARPAVAEALGFGNVEFLKGRIEDLALDLEFLDRHLASHPVSSHTALDDLAELTDRVRRDSPLIPANSVDVVISNCVLNLVTTERKRDMFIEIARVLRPGGRAVISDIVADIDVPEAMRADPQLWSGCYSGAMREEDFLAGFLKAGLTGLRVIKREDRPWETVGDVTFRSVTVEAHKPAAPPPVDGSLAATYLGPFAQARIDTGLDLPRGVAVRLGVADLAAVLTGAYRDQVQLTDAAGASSLAPVVCGPSGCC